jgi:hypothetical protein
MEILSLQNHLLIISIALHISEFTDIQSLHPPIAIRWDRTEVLILNI